MLALPRAHLGSGWLRCQGQGSTQLQRPRTPCRQLLFLRAWVSSKTYSFCALCLVLLDNGGQGKKRILGSIEELQSFKELAKRIWPIVSLNVSLIQETLYDFCNSRKLFFNENILSPPVKNKYRQRKQDNIELEGRILQNIRADSSLPIPPPILLQAPCREYIKLTCLGIYIRLLSTTRDFRFLYSPPLLCFCKRVLN